jgi:hypothetical protein
MIFFNEISFVDLPIYVCVLPYNNNIVSQHEGRKYILLYSWHKASKKHETCTNNSRCPRANSVHRKEQETFFYHSKGFYSKATFCSLYNKNTQQCPPEKFPSSFLNT